jgi:hypothetical protein
MVAAVNVGPLLRAIVLRLPNGAGVSQGSEACGVVRSSIFLQTFSNQSKH